MLTLRLRSPRSSAATKPMQHQNASSINAARRSEVCCLAFTDRGASKVRSLRTLFLEKVNLSGKAAGIEIVPVTVRSADEIAAAFATILKGGAGALVMQGSLPSRTVAALALKQRLPAGSFTRSFAEVGGLMSYGPNATDSFQRGLYFVIKILKGGKPAEIPAEQPTKFELVINLKTAKALGLEIPPILLARADEVIE